MGDNSAIQWTDATWNPVAGCAIHSPGCKLCYAMGEAARQIRCAAGLKRETHYEGTVEVKNGRAVWTGKINAAPDHIWERPLHWRKPRKIFVNSMSDLFADAVPDEWIDRAFAIMALSPQHTFQLLTKRSARMRAYLNADGVMRRIYTLVCDMVTEGDVPDDDLVLIAPFHDPNFAPEGRRIFLNQWPIPNIWLGVSTERQDEADERIPDLLQTPATVRFISAEPLIGPIDLTNLGDVSMSLNAFTGEASHLLGMRAKTLGRLDWVIVGGESSRLAVEQPRPMHPDWARSLRDQCAAAGVPFFFKQWGDWGFDPRTIDAGGPSFFEFHDGTIMQRYGTKSAGRILDGRTHDEFPAAGGGNGSDEA